MVAQTLEQPTAQPSPAPSPPAKGELVTQPKREIRVVEDNGPLAYLMDTARFEHVYRIAKMMSVSALTPDHLRGKSPDEGAANCFRICNQALRWGMDPFAVGDASYLVYGKLGYEGKLIAGVVNARAGLADSLNAIYNTRKADDFACVVFGSKNPIDGAALPLLESYADTEDASAYNKLTFMGVKASRLTFGEGKTFEKDGKTVKGPWTKNVAQKLFYSCVAKWARRWMPEILLGVLTDDDVDRIIDAAPAQPPVGRINLRIPLGNGTHAKAQGAVSDQVQSSPGVAADAEAPRGQAPTEESSLAHARQPGEDEPEAPGPFAASVNAIDEIRQRILAAKTEAESEAARAAVNAGHASGVISDAQYHDELFPLWKEREAAIKAVVREAKKAAKDTQKSMLAT